MLKKTTEDITRQLLINIGEDPKRQGLLKTPSRVQASFEYLTSGYKKNIQKVLNSALFDEEYDEMVVLKDLDIYSLCEHHLLPFFGKCHIAYIPNGRIV